MPMPIIMDFQYGKGGGLGLQREKQWAYMEIVHVKIESDECLISNIAWTQRTSTTIDLRAARIQANAEAFILKNSPPSFVKF